MLIITIINKLCCLKSLIWCVFLISFIYLCCFKANYTDLINLYKLLYYDKFVNFLAGCR